MNSYKQKITERERKFILLAPGIFAVIGIGFFVFLMKCKINFETLFLLFWFIILIRVSYKIYNSPYKISIFDDQIEFISLSNKKKRIQISDLNQIKVTLYGWVTFHYNGGELTGTKNFNEFKDMINLIKEKNPSVITSGC